MIISIWNYRKFIWDNAWRDLRHRYAGSAAGFLWNVMSPLCQILIFTLIFSRIMQVRIPGLPAGYGFTIYLCVGLIPWMSFSATVSRCANSFIENANYLKKMAIPEQIFVVQNALSSFLSLIISMTLLIGVCCIIGHYPTWSWLSLPIILILFQIFGFGLGLFLGVLNAFFRDVTQITALSLQLWFWATPIVYQKDILPDSIENWLYLNPAYHYIYTLQDIGVEKAWPDLSTLFIMFFLSIFMLLLGYIILFILRSDLRDTL